MSTFAGTFRGRYRPSGRVDLNRFAPLAAGTIAAAAGFAWFLWLGFEGRIYTPIVFTLGGVMACGGLSLLAVRLGHCRSPATAALLGLTVGLLLQPGQHLLPYLLDLEPGTPASVEDFVRHLDRRLSEVEMSWGMTPRIQDPEPGQSPSRGDYLALWAATIFEMALIPLACLLPPWLRVLRNPYCESGGDWAERIRLSFQPGTDGALIEALDQGRIGEIAPALIMEYHPNRPAVIGLLDACSTQGADGVAGYLSLRTTRGESPLVEEMEALFPYSRLRLRCAALSAHELEGLRALTPEQATQAVRPEWLEELEDEAWAGDVARLETVEQPQQPPTADRRARQIAEILNLSPLLAAMLVGFGLLAAAAELEDQQSALPHVLGVSGFVVMILGVWVFWMDPHLIGDRYLLRRAYERIAQRQDALARPDEAGVLPVALVPRGAWAGKRDELVDHGLLAIRDVIAFEGDRQRITIPAASLRGIYPEILAVDQYQAWHFTIVEAQADDGLHQLPFLRVAAPLLETLFRSKKHRSNLLLERLVGFAEENVHLTPAQQ